MIAFRPAGAICLLLCAAAPLQAQTEPGPIPEQGHPAKLPRALQYDFTSRITGRPYRLTITPPINPDPSLLYPALFVWTVVLGLRHHPKWPPSLVRPAKPEPAT